MRHQAKFSADRSNCCRDMAVFHFFKMAASAICEILTHGPVQRADMHQRAKFGRNRFSSFDNMPLLMFCEFGLKMPIHAPFWVVFGDLTP